MTIEIENDIKLYKKRLAVHFSKKSILRDNYRFECARKIFYRTIVNQEEKNKQVYNEEKIFVFWKDLDCNVTDPDHSEILEIINDTMNPVKDLFVLDTSNELIESIIEKLPLWKAFGKDRIYNYFIKKLKSIRKY